MGLPGIEYAPKDITVDGFFSDFLPKQFDKYKPIVEQFAGDLKGTMSFKLDSAEYTCSLSKDGLQIDKGLSDDAMVTLMMSDADFKMAITGERQMAMGPPGGGAPDPAKMPEMIKNAQDILSQIQGVLEFRVTDADGDFVTKVKFAGPLKDDPDVSVTVAREDAEAMSKGELDPQTAFMQGKMQISGDMTLLMQLTPLMMQ